MVVDVETVDVVVVVDVEIVDIVVFSDVNQSTITTLNAIPASNEPYKKP